MSNTSRCPKCGNLVQATSDNSSKELSFEEKCIKKSIKKSVCEVVNPGAVIGAAIGSVIPCVGTFAGSVVGGVINDIAFDMAYGKAKETLSSNNCIYQCPKCGHVWTDNDDMMDLYQEEDSNDYDDFDLEEFEKEMERKYQSRKKYFWNHLKDIVHSSSTVIDFIKKYESSSIGLINRGNTSANNYALNSLACLFYINDHPMDHRILLLGKENVKKAKNAKNGHSAELTMIDVLFSIYGINHNAPDVLSQQKSIMKKAPKKTALTNNDFLESEYLYGIYEACRYDSLVKSYQSLQSKGNTSDASVIYQMIQELENNNNKGKDIKRANKSEDDTLTSKSYSKSQTSDMGLSSRSVSISQNDQDYLEEVKACLDDGGSISASERRLLNKLRERLGISIEHAEELEASLTSIQLTSEENEYLEEYKACLVDGGIITSGERRLLNRMSSSYGISEERVKEIETLVN